MAEVIQEKYGVKRDAEFWTELGHSDRSGPLDLKIRTEESAVQISLVSFYYPSEAEYWIEKTKHGEHNHIVQINNMHLENR